MQHFDIELHDQTITKIGITAITDFYRTISVDQLLYADIFAFATGIDSPFLNVVIDTRPLRQNSSELIKSLSNFFDTHHVPWGWFVTPATHENDLTQQGLSLLEEAPAMYFDLENALPNLQTDHITIKEGFQAKEGEDRYRKLNADILKNGSGKLKHFIAYHQNNVAAAGTLFLSNDSVMLHNLATRTAYTKRGIGTALTLHMMAEAKQLGFKHCFLDSSEDGFNLYKKVGFKIYSTTLIYAKS